MEFVGVRMPRELIEKVRAIAERSERTFSQEIRLAVKKHVQKADDDAKLEEKMRGPSYR